MRSRIPSLILMPNIPGSLGGATTRQQALSPYSYYSSVSVRNPHLGNSIYHAALLTVQKRFDSRPYGARVVHKSEID